MTEKESKTKWFLDWAHHFYWIRELLLSLGGGTFAEAWLGRLWSLSWEWKLAIWFTVSAALFWILTAILRPRKKGGSGFSKADLRELLEDVRSEAMQAALLGFMWARATDLQVTLEALWHHWDNEGEKLIHPLDGMDKLKGDNCKLTDERRDFMVLYLHHLTTLKVEFPDFKSDTVTVGYPSQVEYFAVRSNLVRHAEKLNEMTKELLAGIDFKQLL